MNSVQEFIYNLIPTFKKRGEWFSFNCPSCYRFGESRPDPKKRGGIRFEGEGIIYNCFNCKFSWGWSPGYHMSKNMRMFLEDMCISAEDMFKLRRMIDEMLDNSTTPTEHYQKRIYRDIPDGYKSIRESLLNKENTPTLDKIYKYLIDRNPRIIEWEDIMWKDGIESFLIPCYEYGKVVGYSLRQLKDNIGNKYIHYIPSGYIYNFDILNEPREYEIVVEGQIDALSLNCISILSNVFTEDKLKRLLPMVKDKKVIILPDRDKAGIKLVDQIIKENLPFGVSFPNWVSGIKDAEDAVKKYGRLYTLYKVIQSAEFDKLKIEVKKTGWFPK